MVRSNAPGLSSSLRLHRNICTLILTGLALTILSSCNFATPSPDSNGSTPQNSAEARREELKTDISANSQQDLTRPPGADRFSVNSLSLNTPGSTSGDLQPARGLNTKRLFSESLRDEDSRFARLEAAVQTIRDEFDTLNPSVNRLMAVEQDIQELVNQLNTLVQGEGAAGTTQNDEISVNQLSADQGMINRAMGVDTTQIGTAEPEFTEGALQNGTGETPQSPPTPPVAATNQPLQIAPPPPPAALTVPPPASAPPPAPAIATNRTETPQSPPAVAPLRPPDPPPPPAVAVVTETTTTPPAGPQLANVRMADSAGKTRIVMETTAPMTYTADLDNVEHILTVIFPAGTSIDIAALGLRSDLVKSVTMTPQSGGGFILAFTLNKGSSLMGQGKIGANADNQRHRIYIDLAK